MNPFDPPPEFQDFMIYWGRPDPKTMDALAILVNGVIEDRSVEARRVVLQFVENAYDTLSDEELLRFWRQCPQYAPADPKGARPFTEWMLDRLRDPTVKSQAPIP